MHRKGSPRHHVGETGFRVMSVRSSVLCSQLYVVWLCRDTQLRSVGEGSVPSEATYTGMSTAPPPRS